MRLLTNMSSGRTSRHVASYDANGNLTLLKFDADIDAALIEVMRLYGKTFGLELRGYMEYGNPKQRHPGMGIWTDDTHMDLSVFWRLFDYHCLEMAKA